MAEVRGMLRWLLMYVRINQEIKLFCLDKGICLHSSFIFLKTRIMKTTLGTMYQK